MQILPFQNDDLDEIHFLQPPDWSDLKPAFNYYLDNSSFCNPIKVVADGRLVGVGTTIFHKDVVWLAHIIVNQDYRNKGIGSKITRALVDSIGKDRYKTISLIATDLGEPVYKKLGFHVDTEYIFLRNDDKIFSNVEPENIIQFDPKHAEGIFRIDKNVSGEDRMFRLSEYINDSFVYIENDEVKGFYMPTFGDGLILAENSTAGMELMKERNRTHNIAVFPVDNKRAIDFLLQNGFKEFRKAKRMYLGEKRNWFPEMMYNRVSGQIG